jgi:2-polyprenyl-3-methyl-5-hydroxy-6-metoxy-1,4-benzoquinol methylase
MELKLNFEHSQIKTSKAMIQYPTLGKLVKKIFGYTLIGNYARALHFRELMKKIPKEEINDVLDLGFGYGEYLVCMAQNLRGKNIQGVDPSVDQYRSVKKCIEEENLSNVNINQCYLKDLNAASDFDLIYSVDVFEHILVDEMPFKDAYKALRPGGRLVVKMPAKRQITIFPSSWFQEHQKWLEEEHIGQDYELKDLEKRFKKEGFEIQYSENSDGPLSRLAWEIGFLSRNFGNLMRLVTLPISKLLIYMDMMLFSSKSKGNSIAVIGVKQK